ncbi:aspartate/glutamate racemase family protein [Modestobacter sp. VKM Ac-2984]|uniref:aspartate/glutamate racemase family protein n=1 Tax=Modestobacter sp. VKM Ac-2984 TaxID=3004138 RepID=UPI0022AABD4D|nr:aspartate/glutamate racemase family protein [Modestobacter sp. VKM Ac-2984]MCZ2815206.1 aspartate/glutamate racemase family protein [Modestobacter sp. VKM Ac-2984]
MLIQVVNPNTTASMTDLIGLSARAAAGPGTVVVAVHPEMGPASIESHYDEALAVPGLLAQVAVGEEAGAAGHVIACFGDPGLDAAREVATGPVVGIAEAGMRTATYLGRTFGVVTTLQRTTGRAWELAGRYGVREQCRTIRAVEIAVLALETDPAARSRIAAECADVVATEGVDAIVLGCAGMADLAAELTRRVGVPVIDGVAAAVATVEGLARLGLRTGKRGEYAAPLPKRYTGALAEFGVPDPVVVH